MDVNAALAEMRQARRDVQVAIDGNGDLDGAARRLAEATEALDDWLTMDGYPPDAWARPHTPSRRERNEITRRGYLTPAHGEEMGAHLLSTLQLVLAREARASIALDRDPDVGTHEVLDVLDGPPIDGTHGLIRTEETP